MSRKTEPKPSTAAEFKVLTEKMHQLWEHRRSMELELNAANTNANKMKHILKYARRSIEFNVLVSKFFTRKFPGTSDQETWNYLRVILHIISREWANLHDAEANLFRQEAENKTDDNGNVSK
ncbi:uncharacterized protein LOC109607977 [Aethina tumida]|uniref:uncharacterized protein LOC109607977 n=1 Tax=Aethina tumida TaxID=116153 RepID=UPI002148DF4F|nr:uncharacterized protein LOC109607977 [Aethina tumida]